MIRSCVEKMGRGGCADSAIRAVQPIEPNAQLKVDLATKLVAVTGATHPAERIADAIAAAGYPAEPALAAASVGAAATKASLRHSHPGRGHGLATGTGVFPYL